MDQNTLRMSISQGELAEIGQFAFVYRKGADDNPWEAQWLEPGPDMLAGFLWDVKPLIERVEVEFAPAEGAVPDPRDVAVNLVSGGLAPVRAHPTHVINWYARDKAALRRPMWMVGRQVTARGTTVFIYGYDPLDRPRQALFPGPARARQGQPVQMASVHYQGRNPQVAMPAVRVYGANRWGQARRIQVVWGLDSRALTGRIEADFAAMEAIEPFGAGVTATGNAQWRDSGGGAGPRGFHVTVQPVEGPPCHRTAAAYWAPDPVAGGYDEILSLQPVAVVTLWTDSGSFSVKIADLDRGPVYVPALGIALAWDGADVPGFVAGIKSAGARTVRQEVRARPEHSLRDALVGVFGDAVAEFPPMPTKAPVAVPMQVDVPEPQLVGQWRLGAYHLLRWTKELDGDRLAIGIWPSKANGNVTVIGAETFAIIQALDRMGLHDQARRGLNYWFKSKECGAGGNRAGGYGNWFTDFDGILLVDDYDMRHQGGHGCVLYTVADHYRMTGDRVWLDDVAPRVRQACDWTIRQRRVWNADCGSECRTRGLLPPTGMGDGYGVDIWFVLNAEQCLGLYRAAALLAEIGAPGADALQREAADYLRDIRMAAEQTVGRAVALRLDDGAYRRFLPGTAHTRRSVLGWYKELVGGALWLFGEDRAWDASCALAQELMDLHESLMQVAASSHPAWMARGGYIVQLGHERLMDLALLNDDVPCFLRSFFNGYAADIHPWETKDGQPGYRFHGGHLERGSIAGRGPAYTFHEHPQGSTPDKTHEESVFLRRFRNLLVMEQDGVLWLARATPRAWLEQGRKIAIQDAPTHFGAVAYEIVSDVDHGKINATVELPARKAPSSILLRFRHPQSAPIKSVTVNGKEWQNFNTAKEAIELKGLTGTVTVTAKY